jgi:vitamin B12 transporter
MRFYRSAVEVGAAALAVAAMLGGAVAAERSIEAETPPVFVSGTKTDVLLEDVPSAMTVIDRATIQQKRLATVADVLRLAPGLDVVRTGGLGGTTSVFLRGGNSSHTLVLIDGVPVNSATTGAFDFADLTTDNIERIEIVRGPQSTLYGSDAVAGVIQIFTRKGKGTTRGTVSAEAGSFSTLREILNLRGADDRTDYSFNAGRIDSAGFSRAAEDAGNHEDDAYRNTTLSGRVGTAFGQSRLEWTGRFTDAEAELDGCDPVTFFCPVDDPNFVGDTRSVVTGLRADVPLTVWWSQELIVSLNRDDLNGIDPDTADNNYRIDARGRRIDWRQVLQPLPGERFSVGYEYEAQQADSESPFSAFEKRTANGALYGLNELRLGPAVLNAGVRFDDHSRYGSETTYKVEGAWLFPTATKLRAAHGTAFRGPTLNDLFFPGFGNPDLEPERSHSTEVGLEQGFGERGRIGATYFRQRIEDLIVFVSDPITFVGAPENVDRARMRGVEAEVWLRPLAAAELFASYTWLEAENEDGGLELPRRAPRKAGGTVSLRPADGVRVVVDGRYVGRRFDDVANAVRLNAYAVWNLAVTWALRDKIELFARGENLFDRDYQEVAGYQTTGRSGHGGVKVTF